MPALHLLVRGQEQIRYKERLTRQSLEFPGEAVHKGLGRSSFSLPSKPARHEISANTKVGDPASTWPILFLMAQLASSASKCHIHSHKTPSILSTIPMKFLQVALLAFLAIASVGALTTPNPAADAEAEAFCCSPGQPCQKLKRVAAALAEPVASAETDAGGHPWCWLPGEVRYKNKRDAGSAPKGHTWCWTAGKACSKAKRQLEELEGAFKAI